MEPVVCGQLANHEAALPFAREVLRVHHRFATEVVATHQLCPHLKDVDSGLGTFIVVLSNTFDKEAALAAVIASERPIIHVVFPLISCESHAFEHFASDVDRSLKGKRKDELVKATFHPQLAGGTENCHRMVGLLRRSPDPFIQFIPPGLSAGGTFLAGHAPTLVPDNYGELTFERLLKGELADVEKKMAAIRADRDESYAAHLAKLAS